ncbi:AcrR family transcriptional regulator [Chromobacterium alkanivorans]|uniref:TetR/AcrR family transcriptional regulator n=1 Tax=Chromobacterium alkanivorans TaxID=1071719 RepID=UPI0021672807|nr:TetR/AcrR family transcriptional regulator [Chromobacterium alkanivorans]MCS3806459.1 AcrR family transcriptional regulator [Chromobacterium alkanivorans]MCS3820846.1 AcrR family transcriptional regulator [Chromobacterium alkanivorans]MCS3875768.1 AcrR family transcriptional regulator [Chromobacterium alkanivorans]
MRHVRVSPTAAQQAEQAAPATRRRPRQSRSRASLTALQQAFVQVLLERGYAKTTVREVSAVAGVAVGTFYQYVRNMDGLAALCIHQHVHALADALRREAAARRGADRREIAAALLTLQLDAVQRQAAAWSALFQLERRVSPLDAYRRHYRQYVDIWRAALAAAAEPPPRLDGAASMAHCLCYGAISQALLTQGPTADLTALRPELEAALKACLG